MRNVASLLPVTPSDFPRYFKKSNHIDRQLAIRVRGVRGRGRRNFATRLDELPKRKV
jgi:hypothetical protein